MLARLSSRQKRRQAEKKRKREYDPHRIMREIARDLVGSKPTQRLDTKRGAKGYDRKRDRRIPTD
ncbi:hypothetical protein HQ571_05890 [Candidatus Kuenenbacteria bacterium]|nr:hypothetical protein [Candidatus Kuenenbacteria bacterium]